MKKLISRLLVVSLLLIPITFLVPTTGCTSTSQQSAVVVEYKTLSSVINTVELARSIYDDLYKAGKVSQDLDNKIAVIYLEYQRVGNLAIQSVKAQQAALTANSNASAPVVDMTNLYLTQLQTLVNQLLDLFNQAPTMPTQPHVLIAPNAGL